MNAIQLSLFAAEKPMAEQRKLLNLLVEFYADAVQSREYHNFWGTDAAIRDKEREVADKVQRFSNRVERAFPGVLEQE